MLECSLSATRTVLHLTNMLTYKQADGKWLETADTYNNVPMNDG